MHSIVLHSMQGNKTEHETSSGPVLGQHVAGVGANNITVCY